MELEPWWMATREAGRAAAVFLPRFRLARSGVPPIRILRAVVLVLGAALVAVLMMLMFLLGEGIPWSDAPSWAPWLWGGALVTGLTAYRAAWRWSTGRVVASRADSEALDAYRRRMFLLIAVAESPVLVAFVISFVALSIVPYLVTLPLSLGLLAHGSPRLGDVRAVQEEIRRRGSPVDLAAVLMGRVEL